MGNQLNPYKPTENNKNDAFRKFRRLKPIRNNQDKFIIEHRKKNKHNIDNTVDLKSLNKKRIVFVSLIGVYNTWTKMPSNILYTALLVIPLKEKWIYNPTKHTKELTLSFVSQITAFSDIAKTKEFIELLKWKNSQGCVFWILDHLNDDDYGNNKSPIAPFWYYLSSKLSNLSDPITRTKYKPLQLNDKFWINQAVYRFDTNTSLSILNELYFVTMQFKSMQEIIYQSNPNSLCPIVAYGKYMEGFREKSTVPVYEKSVLYSETMIYHNNDENNWFMSPDYDPYDIEEGYHDQFS